MIGGERSNLSNNTAMLRGLAQLFVHIPQSMHMPQPKIILKKRGLRKRGLELYGLFLGKVQIVSRTLSGLFLVGDFNRPRKRKGTNRENPRTIPEEIGKIPEKSGKSQKRTKKDKKGQKRTKKDKKGQKSPDRETPRLKPPRLAALEKKKLHIKYLHSGRIVRG